METTMKKCILCYSVNIKLVTTIDAELISSIYNESFKSRFDGFFNNSSIGYFKCNNCHINFFDPSAAGNDKFYEHLQKVRKEGYYNRNRPEFKIANSYINSQDKVLEIGAGDGDFALQIDSEYYIGLEFNDMAIQNAKIKGVSLLNESIEFHSDKTPDYYDVVLSHHVHEHVVDLNKFIISGIKSLKPGGKYIVSVPNCNNPITTCVNHTLNLPPHHITRFRLKSMEYFSNFGLELIDYKTTGAEASYSYKISYVRDWLTKKLSLALYQQDIVIDSDKKKLIDWRVNKIPNFLFKLMYPMISNDLNSGLNMIYIFKKI
jgi:2-polyprenyl-3-methyl-5-hydroxy-6-metoxy-1,4-benzoquinol methylase